MPIGEEPGEDTQSFAASGNSRPDRPDRQVENCCCFLLCHALQSDQQNGRTLLIGELDNSALQIA